MNLQELLTQLDTPIVIRPTRRMTQGELETYLDKAADILRGNADHSEFRGYVFALLFYKRISDCYDEEVRTQTDALVKAGVPRDQALLLARDPQNHHFTVPEHAAWADVARTAKGQLGQALNEAMLSIERANAHRQNNFDGSGARKTADVDALLFVLARLPGPLETDLRDRHRPVSSGAWRLEEPNVHARRASCGRRAGLARCPRRQSYRQSHRTSEQRRLGSGACSPLAGRGSAGPPLRRSVSVRVDVKRSDRWHFG